MSRHRLLAQIARATGETERTIRAQGFSLLRLSVPVALPEPRLCVSCPGCGGHVAVSAGESSAWAECAQCDISYPYRDDEVFLPDEELELAGV